MSENILELVCVLRENDNPEQACMTAAEVIIDFLKQHESSEEPASAGLPAHG